jgi:hypothetical protein
MVGIERSVELPASIDADGAVDPIDTSADVTVTAAPEETVYDDGRIVRTVTATVPVGDGTYTTSLRRMRDARDAPVWRSDLTDAGEGPGPPAPIEEALGAESTPVTLSITGDAARRLADVDDGIRDALDERRSRLQSEHAMSVVEDDRWVRGSGGMQATHAAGAVTVGERRLPLLWRDGVDVGHQVWVREADVDLDGFEDSVIDAAVALAIEQSPLRRVPDS